MIDQRLLTEVFDKKVINIIKALVAHSSDFFSIRELSEKAGVTTSTTFRIIKSLERVGLIKRIQRGRVKFFQIQKAARAYKQFSELFGQKKSEVEVLNAKIEELYPNCKFKIYLSKKDKKQIFIISEDELDDDLLIKEVDAVAGKKFKIMSIHPNQFKKMQDMGIIQ